MYISFALGGQRKPHFQWNIGGVGSSGVGHVYFMYNSCCLCIIFRVGYANISRRKGIFQWNMGLKPIFHRKLGSRWVPNANEIYTKNMKYTWPTPEFCVGTRRNLYSTGLRLDFASGKTQLLGFASGKTRKMCVTQRQRYQHVSIFCVR